MLDARRSLGPHSDLIRILIALLLAVPLHAATPAELRAQIRAALRVPSALPALDLELYGDLRITPDVVIERVSYATGYGLRVPAIVYRPAIKPAGRMPGLIVVNGHGGDKYSWYAFYAGILYARAGAVVVTYDPISARANATRRSNPARASTINRSTRPRWAATWAAS